MPTPARKPKIPRRPFTYVASKDYRILKRSRSIPSIVAASALLLAATFSTPASAQSEVTECDRLTANEQDPSSPLRHHGSVAFEDIDAPKAIGACKKDLEADPNNARLRLNLGRAYNKAEDYKKSFQYTKEAVDAKYGYAFHVMALHYYLGEGVEKNPAQIERYLELGVKYRIPASHAWLGGMELDKGVPRANLAEAESLIEFARKQGWDTTLHLARLNHGKAKRVLYDQVLGVSADAEPVVIATYLDALDLRVYRSYLISARDLFMDYFKQNKDEKYEGDLERIQRLLRKITDEEINRKIEGSKS